MAADEGRLKMLAEAVGQAIRPKTVQAVVQMQATGMYDVHAAQRIMLVAATGVEPVTKGL